MFDIGMTELLLIGIVALIVVGPKDLPGLFRTLGRFTAKARSLGREFTRAMNEAADESGMKDVAADLKKATSPKAMGLDALKDAADKFEQWDPSAHPAAKHGKDVFDSAKQGAAEKAAERAAEADAPAKPAAKPSAKKTTKPAAKPSAKSAKGPKPAKSAKPAKKAPKAQAEPRAKPSAKPDSSEKTSA